MKTAPAGEIAAHAPVRLVIGVYLVYEQPEHIANVRHVVKEGLGGAPASVSWPAQQCGAAHLFFSRMF